MYPTREEAFEKISSLVERFREHIGEYKRGIYNASTSFLAEGGKRTIEEVVYSLQSGI